MLLEKLKASQQMGAAAMSKNPSLAKLLTPWDRATRGNARRLRKKRGWRL